MGGNEVADEGEDLHDDVFGDGGDVGAWFPASETRRDWDQRTKRRRERRATAEKDQTTEKRKKRLKRQCPEEKVPTSDFVDGEFLVAGGGNVDVVRADTGGDRDLEVLGLGQPVARDVARVEGRGDDNVGVFQVLFKLAAGTFLVRGDDESVAERLEPGSQAERVFFAAEESCEEEEGIRARR